MLCGGMWFSLNELQPPENFLCLADLYRYPKAYSQSGSGTDCLFRMRKSARYLDQVIHQRYQNTQHHKLEIENGTETLKTVHSHRSRLTREECPPSLQIHQSSFYCRNLLALKNAPGLPLCLRGSQRCSDAAHVFILIMKAHYALNTAKKLYTE